MIKIILFFLGILIGGTFIYKYWMKKYIFLSIVLFLGGYIFLIFYLLCLKIPLNKGFILLPFILLPFLFPVRIKNIHIALPNMPSLILIFILLVILIFGVVDTIKYPLYERDGLDIWLTKAKMIYLDKTIYSENFFDADRIQDHPRYPLFLPIFEASYFSLMGINERNVKIIGIFIWLLILGVIFETLLRTKIGLNNALFALILLSLIPAYYLMPDGSLNTGYADIPLSLFYLGAIITFCQYFESGEKASIMFTGIFSSFAIFTKNEGIAFAISIFIIMVFFRKRKQDIGIFLLSSILPIIPYLIIKYHLPNLYTEHYLSHIPEIFSHISRIAIILRNAIFEAFNPKHWGIFWVIVIYIFSVKKTAKHLHPIKLLIIVIFGFYLGIFLITPWDINFQMKIVFSRMLLHLAPSATFLCFSLLNL